MASQHQQRPINSVAQTAAPPLVIRAITRMRLLGAGIVLTQIVVAILLIGALTHPAFQPIDVGSAGDERFLSHFYAPETDGGVTYRWSGPDARLVLHGTTGAPHVLRMRMFVPPPPTRPLTSHVQLVHGESVVADWTPVPGWHTYHVLLPAGATTGNGLEAAPLTIVTPLHRPGPGDQRDLGVALNWLEVQPLAWRMPLGDPSLLRALALAWGFALVTLLFWHADQAFMRRTNGAGALARTWLASVGMGAALVLWARRDPALLAWALPATPWLFGVLTVAAVGPTIAQHGGSFSRLRVSSRWLGLLMLAVAQVLLWTQAAVLLGALLVVAGWLVGFAPSSGDTLTWAPETPQSISRRAALAMLAGVLVVGAAFRFYQLASFPFGMWRDEARYGLVGLQMLQNPQSVPAFITDSYVNLPALGLAPFAVAIKLFGIHVWSMRVATALAGTLALLPMYGIATLLSGRRAVGLLAAGLLAASSWQVMMSRLSFPAIFEPLCTLAALWFMLWSLRAARGGHARPWLSLAAALAAGACLGVSVQTYFSARLAPLTLGLFALLAGWRWHVPWRRWLVRMALLGAGALLVALPLIQYAIANPDAFNSRVDTVFILTDALSHARAPLAELDESLGRHLLMFNAQGDMNGRHHAPGRPLLDLLSGFGLLVGIGALWQTRRAWQSQAIFAALLLGVLPSALAVDGPHAMRSISAAPWAYVIAALGWAAVWHITRQQDFVAQRKMVAAGALALMLGVIAFNAGLLRGMRTDPAVWQSFYPTHTQIGSYIRALADADGPAATSNMYVDDDLARNSVMQYLTYGLPVQTFVTDHLPQHQTLPPQARVILSGYTYQRDLPRLVQACNLDPTPLEYGPPLPGTAVPSFVIYGPRIQK